MKQKDLFNNDAEFFGMLDDFPLPVYNRPGRFVVCVNASGKFIVCEKFKNCISIGQYSAEYETIEDAQNSIERRVFNGGQTNGRV